MLAVRYRSGMDRVTGKVLRGRAHLAQSIATIWLTRPDTRVMLLDFATDLRSHLSEDLTPSLALDIYDDLVGAILKWEPEYRISEVQFVSLTRIGGLGLRHNGIYYPEGRLGNYALKEDFKSVTSLARYEGLAIGRAA